MAICGDYPLLKHVMRGNGIGESKERREANVAVEENKEGAQKGI